MIHLVKKTVNVLVRDIAKKGIIAHGDRRRFGNYLVQYRRYFVARALCAYLHEPDSGPFVKHHNKKASTDDADIDTLAFALMENRGEYLLSDQLGHTRSSRHISGSQRREARCVHAADLAMKGDRLTVSVNKKHNPGGALNTQPFENVLDTLKLLFL
jgi:hypothetical protein